MVERPKEKLSEELLGNLSSIAGSSAARNQTVAQSTVDEPYQDGSDGEEETVDLDDELEGLD